MVVRLAVPRDQRRNQHAASQCQQLTGAPHRELEAQRCPAHLRQYLRHHHVGAACQRGSSHYGERAAGEPVGGAEQPEENAQCQRQREEQIGQLQCRSVQHEAGQTPDAQQDQTRTHPRYAGRAPRSRERRHAQQDDHRHRHHQSEMEQGDIDLRQQLEQERVGVPAGNGEQAVARRDEPADDHLHAGRVE